MQVPLISIILLALTGIYHYKDYRKDVDKEERADTKTY